MASGPATTLADEVQKLLPDALIQYLWTLTEQKTADVDAAFVMCALSSAVLNGETVQKIDFWGQQHFLTGFLPVCCRLYLILYPDGTREMFLSETERSF